MPLSPEDSFISNIAWTYYSVSSSAFGPGFACALNTPIPFKSINFLTPGLEIPMASPMYYRDLSCATNSSNFYIFSDVNFLGFYIWSVSLKNNILLF